MNRYLLKLLRMKVSIYLYSVKSQFWIVLCFSENYYCNMKIEPTDFETLPKEHMVAHEKQNTELGVSLLLMCQAMA